jgi:transposase
MTPSERKKLQACLREASEILYNNAEPSSLETLEELCDLLEEKIGIRVSRATMGRITQRLNYSVKKNSLCHRKRK